MRFRYFRFFAALVVACGVVQTSALAQSPSTPPPLRMVAFGDSWPEGDHCGHCDTFIDRYADDLGAELGREVILTDLSGQAEPGLEPRTGETSETLLASLRFNPDTQEAARAADIVVIATGSNDLEALITAPAKGDCADDRQVGCVEAIGRLWTSNLNAILDEVALLRGDAPTAVRLVSPGNFFLSDPSLVEILSEDLAPTKGELIFSLLAEANCAAAEAHGAVCLDVRPIINGPTMDQPGDENSPEMMQAVADALLATGLPELGSLPADRERRAA